MLKHLIKINYSNGEEVTTRINGTKEEIYTFYRENNFFNWCSSLNDNQVKQIQFIESSYLSEKTKELNYMFFDYDKNGLLQ